MIGIVVTLAIAASKAGTSGAPPSHGLPTRAEAQSEVMRCDLSGKSVNVKYDPSMQEDIVWIARTSGALTERQLTCIASASLKTRYYVYFWDRAVQKRYDLTYSAQENTADMAHARRWLRERNLLATLPLPHAGQPLARYTEAVEAHCGIRKGSVLAARDEHDITFAEGGLGRITAKGIEHAAANETQFECVMAATSAADLKAYGIFFGLIGNAVAGNR